MLAQWMGIRKAWLGAALRRKVEIMWREVVIGVCVPLPALMRLVAQQGGLIFPLDATSWTLRS